MNTPDTERHELGIEHSTGANSTHLLKTTPDTEWTDAVEDIVRRIETLETDYSDGSYVSTSDAKKIGNDIQNLLTSRDTYWKERVEETRTTLLFIGEKVLKEMSEIYAVDIKYADKKQWLEPSEFERIFLHRFNEAGLEALDTLLDNLK